MAFFHWSNVTDKMKDLYQKLKRAAYTGKLARTKISGPGELLLECSGDTFVDCFDYFTGTDPTSGYVDYVDQSEAASLGLIKVDSNGTVILKTVTGAGGPAKSLRLHTNQVFTTGLFIADITHMPVGLGSWPAYWSTGPDWPKNGEIDTIEIVSGSNTYTTLHTQPGCFQYIEDISNGGNCNAGDGCDGCGVTGGSNAAGTVPDNAGGTGFNAQGGGVYATYWTNTAIQIYMWNRTDIPKDILKGRPNPLLWGAPYVSFPIGWGTNCHYQDFAKHQIIINTDFCGSWAGAVFPGYGSYGSGETGCTQYVAATELPEAYWGFNYIKVFAVQ